MLSASRISEDSCVNTGTGTVRSNVVLLVVAIVVVAIVFLPLTKRLAFGEFVEFLLFLSFLLNTVGKTLVREARILAVFFVVVVVVTVISVLVVVGFTVTIVVLAVTIVVLVLVTTVLVLTTVLATVLARFLGSLTFVLTRFLQSILVGLDEFSHLDNVFSTITAGAAAFVRAKLELGNEVASETFFSLKHRDRSATIKLESGTSNPVTNLAKDKEQDNKIVREMMTTFDQDSHTNL